MKKIIIIGVVLAVFIQTGITQNNPLDQFMTKYASDKNYKFLELKTNMIGHSKEDNTSVNKVLRLKMITQKESGLKGNDAVNFYDEFFKTFNKKEYVGLVEVKSSGDNIEILVKNKDNFVSEFIIAINEESETTIIAASGNFDLKDLAKLSEFQNCKGLQVLDKLCEE
ncbi:MAG: DUF4252 domain-containing protein [Bacteroidales bacterium]|nr:DUF4252 domain-containing protein [Bacteroidales bacterium]MCF8403052.1 DUF4252 domain-containing protein [Bacteroidales bacterium]